MVLSTEKYARVGVNLLPPSSLPIHAHWLNYIRVDDAVETARRVGEMGGRILVAPHVDRHGGKIAIVADPQGAAFGLFEWGADSEQSVSK